MPHERIGRPKALDLVRELQDGTPSIHVDNSRVAQGIIGFAPIALKAGDAAMIVKRLSELLACSP
jgi:hypothetical protein